MVEDVTGAYVAEAEPEVLDLARIDRFMNRVFKDHQETLDLGSEGPPSAPARSEHGADDVDELILRASKAIEVLAARCEILGQELAEANDHVAEQDEAINQWKSLAAKLQVQAATSQKVIADLKSRAESAETRVISLEAAEAEARDRAMAADVRSGKLRGQVIAAFGHKSPIHSVLQAVTFQEAAE